MVTPCIPGYHLYRAADGSQPPRIPAAPAWDTIPYDEPKVSLEKKRPHIRFDAVLLPWDSVLFTLFASFSSR